MIDVRTFLIKHKLIEPHDLPQSGEFRTECPECHHHNKKCYINAEGKGVHCFHCGLSKSWLGFMRLHEPPTDTEVALEKFVATTHEFLIKDENALAYLQARGLTLDTIQTHRLGYLPKSYSATPTEADVKLNLAYGDHWALAGYITIPYLRDGYILTVRGRAFDEGTEPKYRSLSKANASTYNTGNFDYQKPLFITEGEFDALILSQLGYQAIGIPGANAGDGFTEFYNKFSKIYICFDGDEAGRKASTKLRKSIAEVYDVVFPEGAKDVSEYFGQFGAESLAALIENAQFYVGNRLQSDDSLKTTISQWEDWAWTNGELLGPKIKWAPRLEQSLSGWSKGLFLIGALPNSGKSCFFVKSAYEAAKDNPDDTMVFYLTLDDDQEDALCRLVSLHTNISFEEIRMPKISFDHPTDKSKRNPDKLKYVQDKLEELKNMPNLIVRDARYGRSLQYVRSYCGTLRKRYPDKHLVIFIDSLAKLTAENEPEDIPIVNWKAHLANELKYLTTVHNLCIVTPADFRKINDARRPTNDDLKDAAELAYEANCVLLGFNEVNIKGMEEATLKWTEQGTGKEWPILEMNLSKNKKSMHRGVIRFKFYPPTSNFLELTAQEDEELTRKSKENDQRRRQESRKPTQSDPTGIFSSSFRPDFSGFSQYTQVR